MSIRQVGLIGAGLMGHGIGKNLLEKGFGLTVMGHRNRAPVDDLVRRGAREAKTAASLARECDMAILCVTGTPEVEQMVYGDEGLLSALRAGFVIADASTAQPDSTVRIAADVAAKGGHFVDIPMTRTPKEAEAGKLGLMVGGPRAVIDRIRPVLDSFADTVIYAGETGAGHTLKLLNNFVALATAAVAAESMAVAARAGVDMTAFRDTVMGGGAASTMFGRLINVPLSDDDSHAKFAIRNARKDLRYYTTMTQNLPVASFMAEQAHQLFVLADNQGYGERFVPRLVDVMMKLNGIAK